MKRHLLNWLVCPRCDAELVLHALKEQGAEVLEGGLRCPRCDREYPIRRGIPRMLPDDLLEAVRQTARQFGDEWTRWFPDFLEGYEQQFVDWLQPIEPSFFNDKVVLDGGCGMGRHSSLAVQYGAREVIAVDLGHAVEQAYHRTRHLPNVHVIQADLARLPIRRECLDYIFSVAVLHHTADPRTSFVNLTRHLKPGGAISAWVYGREGNGWVVHLVTPLRRWVTSRIPPRLLYALSWVLTLTVLAPLLKGVYRPLNRFAPALAQRRLFYNAYLAYISRFHLRHLVHIVYDHLTPSIASYIRGDEFQGWFTAAGLEEIVVAWHNGNSWRGTARKPAREPAAMVAAEAGAA